MKHAVYVSRSSRGLGHKMAYVAVKKAATAALEAEGVPAAEINVLLTDDDGIREINLEFRGADRATDVLSFPQNELAPGVFELEVCERDLSTGRVLLGDIAISLERVKAQSEEFETGFVHELSYLTIHSVLHLLGYDHEEEGTQKRMMREREKAIVAALGL